MDLNKDPIPVLPFGDEIQSEDIAYQAVYGSRIVGGTMFFGSGDKCLRFDPAQGLYMGNANFDDAPFRVNMDGDVISSSATFGEYLNKTTDDLDDVLDGSTYIKATTNQVAGGGRAYEAINSSYYLTKGIVDSDLSSRTLPTNGVRLDSSGLYGRKSGATTFYINSSGDAYFSGAIGASTIDAGEYILLNSGGDIWLTGTNTNPSEIRFRLEADPTNDYYTFYGASDGVSLGFTTNGGTNTTTIWKGYSDGTLRANKLDIGTTSAVELRYVSNALTFATEDAGTDIFRPSANSGASLGNSSYQWKDLYVDGVAYIDGFGESVLPSSNDAYDLGSTTYNWRNLYLSDSTSYGLYFGSTRAMYLSGGDVQIPVDLDVNGAIIATGDVTGDDINSNKTLTFKGTSSTVMTFSGDGSTATINKNFAPDSGNTKLLGTASNYWKEIHYATGGLNDHSTPMSERDEFSMLKTFKNKEIIDKKTKKKRLTIDKDAVDSELASKDRTSINVSKVIMALVGAVNKLDNRLEIIENT